MWRVRQWGAGLYRSLLALAAHREGVLQGGPEPTGTSSRLCPQHRRGLGLSYVKEVFVGWMTVVSTPSSGPRTLCVPRPRSPRERPLL